MLNTPSPVSAEIAWLGFFLAIFAGLVYLLVRFLVPHHFNDKVAIMLAALFAGLIMIGTRFWLSKKWREG